MSSLGDLGGDGIEDATVIPCTGAETQRTFTSTRF